MIAPNLVSMANSKQSTKSIGTLFFGVTVLAFTGLATLDIAAVLFISGLQIFIGALLWMWFRGENNLSFIESVGMGGAIGFSLSMLSSQIFRTILPTSIAWLFLPIVVVGVCLKYRRENSLNTKIVRHDQSDLIVVGSGSLLALSTTWYWLIPTAVTAVILTSWWMVRKTLHDPPLTHRILNQIHGVIGLLVGLKAIFGLVEVSQIRSPQWWSLRFGVMQDPDLIFAESMMRSVRLFGKTDNIFFAGNQLHYHWFSFAWSDTLNAFYATEPFAISSRAAPFIVIFVILSLVWTIASRISLNQMGPPFAVLAVSAMCAGPIPFLRVLHPYSYSFNFSIIYLFAIIVLLLTPLTRQLKAGVLLVSLFSAVAVGSKVSTAPFLVAGFTSLTIYRYFKFRVDSLKYFLLAGASALSLISVWFLLFYEKGKKSGSEFEIGFADLFWQKAFMAKEISGLPFVVGTASLILLIVYPVFGLLKIGSIFKEHTQDAVVFSISAGFVGLICSLTFFDLLESSAYLTQASLAIFLPFSIVAVTNVAAGIEKHRLVFFATSFFIGATSAKVVWTAFAHVTGGGNLSIYKYSLLMFTPLILGAIATGVLVGIFKFGAKNSLVFAVALTIVFSTIGSYLSFAPHFYRLSVSTHDLDFDPVDDLTGSSDYRELFNWISENSNQADVVAVNRYCLVASELPADCLALWNLTSALSGRQMLAEGLYPPGSQDLDSERERRRVLIDQFVKSPNDDLNQELQKYGVRFVIVDFAISAFSGSRTWAPFATIKFKSNAGLILELTLKN